MLKFANLLLIIGGLNWGLWGFFEFDLVATLLGGPTAPLAKFVYLLVGASAVYQVFNFNRLFSRRQINRSPQKEKLDRAA